MALKLAPSRGARGVLEQKDDAQTCTAVAVLLVVEEGRSHGCKSMPDSVNVSEIQPSMERHTSAMHAPPPAAPTSFLLLPSGVVQIARRGSGGIAGLPNPYAALIRARFGFYYYPTCHLLSQGGGRQNLQKLFVAVPHFRPFRTRRCTAHTFAFTEFKSSPARGFPLMTHVASPSLHPPRSPW